MKYIELSRGLSAMVDDDLFDWLNQWDWSCCGGRDGHFYAVRVIGSPGGVREPVMMHKLIAGASKAQKVDHKDGNTLNNQRQNLRIATQSQNNGNRRMSKQNKSGFKGVTLYKKTGQWKATIGIDRKTIHLGYFSEKIDAARKYDEHALKIFGEFALTNVSLGLLPPLCTSDKDIAQRQTEAGQ